MFQEAAEGLPLHSGKKLNVQDRCCMVTRSECTLPEIHTSTPVHSSGSLFIQLSSDLPPSDGVSDAKDDVLSLSSTVTSQAPPEITLSVQLSGAVSGDVYKTQVRGVVDHGAGFSYIINPSEGLLSRFSIASISRSVRFADGDTQDITQQLQAMLSVFSVDSKLSTTPVQVGLGIITSSSKTDFKVDRSMVIIGRDLIDSWPLVCHGASSAFIQDFCVYRWCEAHPDHVNLCSAADSPFTAIQDISELQLPSQSVSMMKSPEVVDKRVVMILNDVVKQGWSTVKRCPGVSFRFRPLFENESADIPSQTHVHELELPNVEHVSKSRNYATAMYNKLTPALQLKYQKLVQEFVDIGWWKKVTEGIPSNCLPGVNVFLIVNDSGKPRLVTDLRSVNSALPPASSEAPCLWQFIGLFRLFSAPMVVFEDAKSAFYRTRLSNKLVLLFTAAGTFTCDRMVFGISCGPGGLNSGLGRLVDYTRAHMAPGLASIFVDDGGLAGSPAPVIGNTKLLLQVMSSAGYEVSSDETKFRALCCSSAAQEVASEMSVQNLSIPIVKKSKILGVSLFYDGEYMVVDCDRTDRLNKAFKFLSSIPENLKLFSPTKREVFAFGGSLSFDPTKLHPCERSCADGWRALFGGVFSGFGWDDPCPVEKLTQVQFHALKSLVSWTKDLLSDDVLASTCRHVSPVVHNQETAEQLLVLNCDASLDGYGFSITSGAEGSVLWEDSQRWKRCERNYHSNKRELIAAKVGISALVDLVDFRTRCYTKTLPKLTIRICSDNLATVSWLTTRTPPKSSRAVEQRSIARLVSAIDDELNLLTKHASLKVVHVPGESNQRADFLSRLFSRTCFVENQKTFTLGEVLADTSSKASQDSVDSLNLILDELPSSSYSSRIPELWCSESYNLADVYYRAKVYRFIFEVLKQHAKKLPLPEFSYGYTEADVDLVARLAQHDDFRFHDHSFLPKTGPLVWCKDRSLILHRSGTPSGQVVYARFIPKTCLLLRNKLVLCSHRETLHGSPERTVSHISMFFSPALLKVAKSVCTFCIPCQVARAKRTHEVPPQISHFDHEFLSKQPAYHTVGVDFLALGEKKKLLTVTCAFTRHVTWTVVKDESMDSAINALKEVQLLRGGVRHVVADRAGYFRTSKFAEALSTQLNGATLELLASRAPFEGGFFEKHHDLGLKRLKVLLRDLDGYVTDLSDEELQQCVNQVTLILNTRPIGSYCSGPDGKPAAITPDSLAFGFTRQYGCVAASGGDTGSLCPIKALKSVRAAFLDEFWRSLKQRSLNSAQYKGENGIKLKTNKPYSKGDPVLVFRPAVRKLQSHFRLGHVAEVVSEHRIKIVYPEGFEQLENVYNVVHVLCFPAESKPAPAVGKRIRVKFGTRSGPRYFAGTVVVDESPFWYVRYDDGDQHWIDVNSADFSEIQPKKDAVVQPLGEGRVTT